VTVVALANNAAALAALLRWTQNSRLLSAVAVDRIGGTPAVLMAIPCHTRWKFLKIASRELGKEWTLIALP